MKYGDFSSLVQLGVGLHAGTILLQLYGEFGMQPLARALERTRSLFLLPDAERPPKDIEQELDRLESKYEIFKIRLFYEYRTYVFINSGVAVALGAILILLAFKADDPIPDNSEWIPILMAALSVVPAPVSLCVLWFDAAQRVKPLTTKADELEKRALASCPAVASSGIAD
jgi:hypothetical protein